jgi:hypothetical protein
MKAGAIEFLIKPFKDAPPPRSRKAKKEDVQVGDTIKVRCHLLRDGGKGCLLGFVTPMHGDKARGHGVEIEWD